MIIQTSQEKDSKRVGLTGGVGSGKSTVARLLGDLASLLIIDADEVCRQLLMPGEEGWVAIKKLLPMHYFAGDGSLKRGLLRENLFNDEQLRAEMDATLHPLARMEINHIIQCDTQRNSYLIEVPLLYEAGWAADFDEVVVVYAPDNICLERLAKRDNITQRQAELMLAAQMPLKEKAMCADHVIDNGGCWLDTYLQTDHLAHLLMGEKVLS